MTAGILQLRRDVGLLTNIRMGVEIAVGLAHLTNRRLLLPFGETVPNAPRSSIADADAGLPASLLDLLELPVEIVHPDEADDVEALRTEIHEWPAFTQKVCVVSDEIDTTDPQLSAFANGRTSFVRPPTSDAPLVRIDGRPLSFYSYFFFAPPAVRRQLHAVIRGVRPRRPYVELGARIASGLGPYHALHLRRSDLTIGIPAYGDVTPDDVARTAASVLPTDELLLVCSEVDRDDDLFQPLRRRFRNIIFANDLILHDHRKPFLSLPRHEDNVLGLLTQELAARATTFMGTAGSTFTAMIQRQRLLRDPNERFLFTADFTPDGPTFIDGEFVETHEGCFTWNRVGYSLSPDVLAWFREWPEAAV